MIGVLKNTWALMLGILLLMLGNGLQGTLLGVRGALENIDSSTMGYVMSAYFIGFLGGSQITPYLLRRVGHVRVFAALGSLVSAAFILYAAIVHPAAWLLLRLMVGFCFSGIYVVTESWLNDSATNETRGQSLSLYLIVQMLGMVLGQLLLNVADPNGYDLFVLITVLVSVSFAPILLSSSPAPRFETARAMSIKELIKVSPLACFGTLLLGGVFATLYGMSPVYATEIGLSIANVSIFVTAIYLGGMLLQYPIGWLSDRYDRRYLIIAVTGMGALTATSGIFIGNHIISLFVVAFLIGGMSNPIYSLLLAYTNDYLDSDLMPAASGGLLFINGCGAMTGPIVVGYAMQKFGNHWFFITIAILMATICAYGIYRLTQRKYNIAPEDLAPHVTVTTRITAVGAEVAIEAADDAQLELLEDEDEIIEHVWSDKSENS
jgi:MFS family permease